jgi:hypothetical protein
MVSKTLTSLDLTMNHIGAKGATLLADVLKSNSTLLSLIVRDNLLNPIGDDGCQVISGSLKTNRTLRHLDLASNNISDDGAFYLAGAIKVTPPNISVWCFLFQLM